jgi:hypothetical protein
MKCIIRFGYAPLLRERHLLVGSTEKALAFAYE